MHITMLPTGLPTLACQYMSMRSRIRWRRRLLLKSRPCNTTTSIITIISMSTVMLRALCLKRRLQDGQQSSLTCPQVQEESAIKWFQFHAREHQLAESMPTPVRYSSERFSKLNSDDESSDRSSSISLADGMTGSRSTGDSPKLFGAESTLSSVGNAESSTLLLNIEEVQKCLMDLGLFPSTEEVRRMHRSLGPDALDSMDASK